MLFDRGEGRFYDWGTRFRRPTAIYVCPEGVERADAERGVDIVPLVGTGHDVDGATQYVAAEPGGYHSFVDFNTLDQGLPEEKPTVIPLPMLSIGIPSMKYLIALPDTCR